MRWRLAEMGRQRQLAELPQLGSRHSVLHWSLAWTAHAEESGATIGRTMKERTRRRAPGGTLAPELAEGHLALAFFFQDRALDFAQTKVELERAIALAPGNAQRSHATEKVVCRGQFGNFNARSIRLRITARFQAMAAGNQMLSRKPQHRAMSYLGIGPRSTTA
jgi:hypothetical protein